MRRFGQTSRSKLGDNSGKNPLGAKSSASTNPFAPLGSPAGDAVKDQPESFVNPEAKGQPPRSIVSEPNHYEQLFDIQDGEESSSCWIGVGKALSNCFTSLFNCCSKSKAQMSSEKDKPLVSDQKASEQQQPPPVVSV